MALLLLIPAILTWPAVYGDVLPIDVIKKITEEHQVYLKNSDVKECSNKAITAENGIIISPLYPNGYPDHVSCRWHIKGKVGEVITVKFDDFDIEDSGSCDEPPCCVNNWVKIGPSNITEKQLCGQSGQKLPLFVSETNKMWIKFHISSVVTGGRGFKLHFSVGPKEIPSCLDHEFRCDTAKCVSKTAICNGLNDCDDGSDEQSCSDTCPSGRFCHSVRHCYDRSKHCDGIIDCLDYSDELYCGYCVTNHTRCGPHSTQCYDPWSQRCNRVMDCTNGEDEKDCMAGCPGKIMCRSGTGCFTVEERCNGIAQCGDSSDEKDCGLKEVTLCLNHEFRCGSGECISKKDMCNGFNDCEDGSDEQSCSGICVSGRLCHSVPFCYDYNKHCDGIIDCPDYSDEIDCGYCIANHTRCGPHSTQCYDPWSQRCNSVMDCANGEDEKDCLAECPGKIMCTSGTGCFSVEERCNGIAQCGDSSDEKDCGSNLCNYEHGGFLCGNGHCIREIWKCDRTNDCGDGTDEYNCLRNSVLTAAVMGSLICALLLIIAISCTCRLYALRALENHISNHETPLSRFSREFFFREPPPSYAVAVGDYNHNLYVENIHYGNVYPQRGRRNIRRARRHHGRRQIPTSLLDNLVNQNCFTAQPSFSVTSSSPPFSSDTASGLSSPQSTSSYSLSTNISIVTSSGNESETPHNEINTGNKLQQDTLNSTAISNNSLFKDSEKFGHSEYSNTIESSCSKTISNIPQTTNEIYATSSVSLLNDNVEGTYEFKDAVCIGNIDTNVSAVVCTDEIPQNYSVPHSLTEIPMNSTSLEAQTVYSLNCDSTDTHPLIE